jgi:hypothetical protein
MAMPDVNEIRALLATERATLLAAVERVPGRLRDERPAPDRWSIAELLEHLARVETGVGRLLALRGQEDLQDVDEAAVAAAQLTPERALQLRNRLARIDAPERVRPTRSTNADEGLARLADTRAELEAALMAARPSALDRSIHTHAVLGPMTLRGWAMFIAHHEARHAQQVDEIAAALGSAMTA